MHQHVDHLDEALLTKAREHRDSLQVWGPAAVTARWDCTHCSPVHTVHNGGRFLANGLRAGGCGDADAQSHVGIPRAANGGCLVQDAVRHLGVPHHVPAADVDMLLPTTSSPSKKLGEAVDYDRTVRPKSVVSIHEFMFRDLEQRSRANFLGPSTIGVTPKQIPAGPRVCAWIHSLVHTVPLALLAGGAERHVNAFTDHRGFGA